MFLSNGTLIQCKIPECCVSWRSNMALSVTLTKRHIEINGLKSKIQVGVLGGCLKRFAISEWWHDGGG